MECAVNLCWSVRALGCSSSASNLMVGFLGKVVVGSALRPLGDLMKENFLVMDDSRDSAAFGNTLAVAVVVVDLAAD